jgi:hypothetical protein
MWLKSHTLIYLKAANPATSPLQVNTPGARDAALTEVRSEILVRCVSATGFAKSALDSRRGNFG